MPKRAHLSGIRDQIKWAALPKGDIRVRFENLMAIKPGNARATGVVGSRQANYPLSRRFRKR